jgi:uncharacterized protein YegL
MKHLLYASLIILFSACELEPAAENTSTSIGENEVIATAGVAAVPTEPASPFYALRPTVDDWPTFTEQSTLSEHLLISNYYIVLDGSGSMDGSNCAGESTKMKVAKVAVNQFAQQIPADANLALYAFDAVGGSQRVALAKNNRELFFNQIKVIRPSGTTPLSTALDYAYRQLQKQAATQLGYGEYHLVVVTDGIATANEVPDLIIQTILQNSPVVIHSIGFCIGEEHSLNQPGLTFYTAASNAEELQRGLQAVLAESTDFSRDNF